MMFRLLPCVFCVFVLTVTSELPAQQKFVANYDEAKVPAYTLPDPLVMQDGTKVPDAKIWTENRRGELLKIFETEVYGRVPVPAPKVTGTVREEDKQALGGTAIRRQVSLKLSSDPQIPTLELLLYLPAKSSGPVPVFLGLNFGGNHTVHTDPAIFITSSWVRENAEAGTEKNKATEKGRGVQASRWQVEKVLAAGYGLATVYYGDIDPDFDDGFQNGVHPLLRPAGQSKPKPDEAGSIAAWAWGLSRVLDYLETDTQVDGKKVAVIGHSRLGKTALWAGATDPRFAIVISNDSGCGGAALSKRMFGETVGRINRSFPHWFCGNFHKYNENEAELPVDQHELIALIAPRPVYVASAAEDRWADPKGEFLGAKMASPVYVLLGTDGLKAEEMPAINQPVMSRIGYHIRSGAHDVTAFDWECYVRFADMHFGRNK
ncbi:MAG: acetylxylan esterase [Planctomycetales bacterium]